MARDDQVPITKTATKARQAEPGPSMALVLFASVAMAIVILATVWLIFFRT